MGRDWALEESVLRAVGEMPMSMSWCGSGGRGWDRQGRSKRKRQQGAHPGVPADVVTMLCMGQYADAPDRVMKLREMFNKAGESKTKLSVNDFSE